jgi:hypothetical protein
MVAYVESKWLGAPIGNVMTYRTIELSRRKGTDGALDMLCVCIKMRRSKYNKVENE